MDIEHVGYVVADPRALARWYVEHLGLRVVRTTGEPNYAHFLADSSGHAMIEVYANAAVKVPDYRAQNLLVLHVAFEADDVEATRARLIAAGATPDGDVTRAPNGDTLATVRDPWGFAVQLAHRAKPMI
jgi:glyoxylase I family protein